MSQAAAQQLFQSHPSDTASLSVYTAGLQTEFTHIVICNTTGTAATYRIFHDDDGSTFDQSTALYYDASIAANSTLRITADTINSGISIKKGGQLAVRSSTASALTFTGYGITSNQRV